MKFVRKSSHSWWWDSHNTPKRSRWLQSALGELDEKTKAMLQLIEEDADSFAQRAEMYYRKRPELIDLVEEFYRAYRSLAERYDHLKDETRHGIPRVVQVQCGISRENPLESPFGEQILPWRNGSRGFRQLLKRQESRDSDSEASEVDDPEPEGGDRRENAKSSDRDFEDLSALSSYESEVDNPSQEVTEDESSGSRMREMQDTISNLQEEKARVLIQLSAESLHTKHLQDEINNLKEERNSMKGEMSLIVQEKGLLGNELYKFKTELKILRNRNEDIMQQMQVLGKDVNNLQEENRRLSKQNKIFSTVLGHVGGQAATFAKTNASSRNKICEGHQQCKAILEILKDEKEKFENMLEAEVKRLSELNVNIDDFQGEICRIGVENRQKKIPLLAHNEEKREIQRQLCFAEASDVDDPEPEADRKENVEDPDEDFDDLRAGSSCESEVDDPPQKVAGNERDGSRMREMQATISRLEGEKARLLKQLSAKSLQSRHLKDKLKILKKQRNFMKEEISPVIQDKGVLEKDLSKFETEHRILRNQNEDVVQHMQALGKDVNDLREENRRLSQQNKIMATVLGFVSGQAASLARSNVRLRNEMCEGNRRCKAIVQILKDEEKKFDNMFEEEVKCVSELDLNIAELQGEICRLAEENQHQKITLLDLSEEKREAIRQLCFAMDALRGRNQTLEAAIGCYRGGGSCSKLDGSSQFSRLKKFLAAALDGNGPQSCILAI